MRLLLRLIILVPLALLGAAVVAAVVVVATIDLNDYRGVIAETLRDATKQPVALRGPLRWSIGFTPTVSIEDVVIGDPAGDTAASSLQVGKLEVSVELLPFLRERLVRISSLTLNDVALVVELEGVGGSAARAAAPVGGTPPASPPLQPETAPPATPAPLPEIVEMQVRNASITVRDRPRDRAWQLVLAQAAMTRREATLAIEAEGRMNETPFTVQGTVGVLAMLSSGTWPVDLTVRSALGQVKLAGSIVDAFGAARPDLVLTVEGPELQRIAALAGVTVPALGPFRGEIKLAIDQARTPTVTALNVAFGRPDLMRVQVQGSIADPRAQRGIDLRVTVEGQETGALSAIVVPGLPAIPVPALGPFQVQARVVDGPALQNLRVQVGRDDAIKVVIAGSIREPLAQRGFALDVQLQAPDAQALTRLARLDMPLRGVVAFQARISDPAPGRFRFENLRATLGPNDAAGDVTVTLGGARPTLAGELTANRIDLASLGAGSQRGGGGGASAGRVFSDSPLPFDRLALADADLRLRAARIDGFLVGLRNAAATIALRDGELTVRPWSVELGGGQASGELVAAARGSLNLRASVRGFNAGALLREAQLSDKLDGGRGELTLDLRGAGRSLRAIMATANGSETLIVRGGTVDNRFFEIIGADLVRWVGQMVRGAERPTLNCAISRFDIRDGLATARVLMFDTSQVTAAGEGTINLATEALALRVQPRPRDASLLSFAVPLDIAGTLSRPTFLPNTVGAIGRTATGVGASIVLGPIGAVMSIANIGGGRDDPCAAATALAQGQAPPRGSAPAAPSQNPIDAIGDGIGRGIRGIFGR